ncbi:MAG: carboxy terminal-processing peptidase [Gammaproteobacteria bacterium]|nr:carboxy terminal-processing peptidase [Gammaproteobacteria bacterium]
MPTFLRLPPFPAAIAWLAAVLLVTAAPPMHAGLADLDETEIPAATAKQARVLKLITYLVDKSHYRKKDLDDDFSAEVLKAYLTKLDPGKIFFLQSDIDQFHSLRHQFDNFIRDGNIRPAFNIYSIFRTRLEQRIEYALERLNSPLDFDRDEEYLFDRKEAGWAADSAELDDVWRKRIKNDIIGLRLANKAEEEVLETLEKRYTHLARRTRQFKSNDVFATFANAYVNTIDPHTAYFSPRASENFHIQMRLSLEGIGAVLQTDGEHTQVRRVIPGGPAGLAGDLKAGDRIIGIAQGGPGDQEIVDVIGWRLDDVVDLIRGPKDSLVSLEILPAGNDIDGSSRVITIQRDTIKLEEQAAKKRILKVDTERGESTIGVIDLPSFYADFNGMQKKLPDYRSTTRDVRKLLAEFQPGEIDGLIIDLRGNGGGALTEAISLTGLFIRKGPVVQVQNAGGQIKADHDPDPEIVYDGPLAVLVDRHSASASEIFAGAIQDYRRGLIIGEPTYGKGTVQHLVNLNQLQKNDDDLGQLKLTVAQFFRVNGGSTQHRGVVPDIIWPSADGGEQSGERAYENALPWRQIGGAEFKRFRDEPAPAVLERIRSRHEQRIQASPEFRYFIDVARINAELGKKKSVVLKQSAREQERERRDQQQLKLENDMRQALGQETLSSMEMLDQENKEKSDPSEAAEASEEKPDAHLREGGNILSDYLYVLKSESSRGGAIATQSEAEAEPPLNN